MAIGQKSLRLPLGYRGKNIKSNAAQMANIKTFRSPQEGAESLKKKSRLSRDVRNGQFDLEAEKIKKSFEEIQKKLLENNHLNENGGKSQKDTATSSLSSKLLRSVRKDVKTLEEYVTRAEVDIRLDMNISREDTSQQTVDENTADLLCRGELEPLILGWTHQTPETRIKMLGSRLWNNVRSWMD
jgi:hypothetical protein